MAKYLNVAMSSAVRNAARPLKSVSVGSSYWALYSLLDDTESRCILAVAIISAIGAGVPIPLMAVVFRGVIESFPPPDEQLNQAVHYLLAISAAYFALTWAWTVTWGVVGGRISRRLQEALVAKILRLDMQFFDTESIDLTSILTADTQTIQRGTSEKVGLFVQSISYFVATFITGFVLSPPLTGVLLAAVFPSMFLLVTVGTSMISRNSRWAGRYTEQATAAAEQAIKAVRVVQAFGAMGTLGNSHARTLHHAAHYAFRKSIYSALMLASIYFVCYSTNSLAFFWGAKLGGSSGTIYAVVFLILDASFVFTQVGPFIQTIAMASAAGQKVLDLIDRAPSEIDPCSQRGMLTSSSDFDSDVVCHDLAFAYPVRPDQPVLKGINLTFKAGSKTGIVGLSGSGKSSLVGLFLRLYDITSGSITIGNRSLREINVRDLRSKISLVDQEPVLFSGSILDNIRHGILDVGKLDPSEIRARCEQAARDANVDFLSALEHGIDSVVGNSGGGLSGGQRQRICLARALVRKPRLLILDEPTSALDSTSEQKILDALHAVSQTGCTIIMIAHRLSTVKDMDEIVVMSDGHVLEQGSHHELLSTAGGAYKALVDAQNGRSEQSTEMNSATISEKHYNSAGHASTSRPDKIDGLLTTGELPLQLPGLVSGQVPGPVPGPTLDQSNLQRSAGADVPSSGDSNVEGEQDEKEYSGWKLLRRCVRLNSRRENIVFAIGLLASAIMGALIVYEAIVFGHLVTILQPGDSDSATDFREVRFYCLMFFIISLIALFASATSNSCFGLVSEMLLTKIRDKALRSILNQDQEFFQTSDHSPQRLIAAISSDANHIAALSGSILATVFSVCVNLVAGVTVAIVFAWSIALVLMAVMPAIMLAGFLRVKLLNRFEKKHHESFKHAAALASEAVQNIRTVAAYGREHDVLRQYKAALSGPYRQNFWYCVFGDLALTLTYSITFFTYALAYWWGSRQVREGHFSTLDFFTMIPAFLLTAQQSSQLFTAAPELLQARTAAQRLFKLLDAKPSILRDYNTSGWGLPPPALEEDLSKVSAAGSQETLRSPESESTDSSSSSSSSNQIAKVMFSEKDVSETPSSPTSADAKDGETTEVEGASLTLSHVSLSYPSKPSNLVLRDVSVHVRAGSTIGLVGPSGAGKSSLIALLERFYDPIAGQVLIDDEDIRKLSAVDHRSRLSYVPQEPSLFEGTVAYNIEIGAPHVEGKARPSRIELERMCKHYKLHSFISSLPEGYNTQVGAGGNRLSGGQRQRIALARALVRRPRLLILDEATSALDAHSEQEVKRILDQVKNEGRTVIMIAHRMATVKEADNIIVMEEGRIIENGQHDDLVRLGGIYATMVQAQELG